MINEKELKMPEAGKPRPVIDVETLEVWPSIRACARSIGVRPPRICEAILLGGRAGRGIEKNKKGYLLEYLDYWLTSYTPAEKERHARQNGFYFL